MPSLRAAFLLAGCLLALPAAAAAPWPALPPGVWEMKADAIPGGKGAVVLLRHLRIENREDAFHVRIRICAGEGKQAAEWPPFPDDVQDLEGRVLYPDGRELPILGAQDFVSRTVVSLGSHELKATTLIPPGLTDDCLLDLRWKVRVKKRSGSVWLKRPRAYELAGPFPVERVVLEVARPADFTWTFQPGVNQGESRTETQDFTILTLKGLPAVEPVPYSLHPTRSLARLKVYQVILPPSRSGRSLWDRIAEAYFKPQFTSLSKGSRFEAFAEDISGNLPSGTQDRAIELALRLRERLRNLQTVSLENLGESTRKESLGDVPDKDLDWAVERGGTSTHGILLIYKELLERAGIHPSLVFGADRDRHVFTESAPDLSQIEQVVVRIQEAGRPDLFMDPAQPHLHPSLVDPGLQGTHVLEVDPVSWTTGTLTIPVQGAETNWRRDAYVLDLKPGEARFRVEAAFGGLEAFQEAAGFRALDPAAQGRRLRLDLEEAFRAVTVDEADVSHGSDLRRAIAWKAAGRVDGPAGRTWTVDPFPVTLDALAAPETWPATREEYIVLPFARVRTAQCRFTLPEGYECPDLPVFRQRNGFGTVAWQAALQGREVTVTLEIQATRCLGAPSEYQDFRTFLRWVREASDLRLTLVRSR